MKKQLKWIVRTYIEGFIFMIVMSIIIYTFIRPYAMTLELSSILGIGNHILFIGFYFIWKLFWLWVEIENKKELKNKETKKNN